MPKITLLGAGSTVFAKNLMGDILSYPELAESTISLHDIDEERLHTSEIVAHKVAEAVGAKPVIEATTDRRESLDGADYAISMIQVAGYKPGTVVDFEIPKKYGLRQTIADTLGIGGIMRGLRTIPVLLDMCADMEELCPDVTFLQYVNPMAMNCMAIDRASSIKTVGLCHSVQGTAEQLARDIGVPIEEINFFCAGINHMAFYLRFERNVNGEIEDLYPEIRKVLDEGRVPDWNLVRYEMFKRLGYFVTESSEHFAEYVPWFIKRDRPDLIEEFNVPLDEYITRCENQIAGWERMRADMEAPDSKIPVRRKPRVWLRHHPQYLHGRAARYQRKRGQLRADRESSRRMLRGSAVPRRQERRAAGGRGRASSAPGGDDADEYQRAGDDCAGGADRRAGVYLLRCDAGSAHRGRAKSRRDLESGRRSD